MTSDPRPPNPTLTVSRPGGREVLEVRDRPIPTPAAGEVLVEVAAAGVNFIDVYQRQGVYPVPTPFALGQEGAGTVVAVGEGAAPWSVRDRVAWAFHLGSAARYAAVPADSLVAVPDGVTLETAAAVMLQGLTAHFLVNDTHPVAPGEWVLVHAAAGGVGQLLVQLAKAKGGRVVATAGSGDKLDVARSLGADALVNYRESEDLARDIREATGGQGVAVAYDGVGKDTFDASLASLAPRGILVLFGGASGQVPPFDIQRLNAGGSLFLTRPSLPHHIATPEVLRARAADVLGQIASGTLHVEVGGRYPLTEACAAYEALEGRATRGKVILVPDAGTGSA